MSEWDPRWISTTQPRKGLRRDPITANKNSGPKNLIHCNRYPYQGAVPYSVFRFSTTLTQTLRKNDWKGYDHVIASTKPKATIGRRSPANRAGPLLLQFL